jgi:signal transduction histidine kinase
VLTIFASQAAALIDDAYLFENHRRQLAEQKVLYHIAREVATAERFEQVAAAIYSSLREVLPLDFGLWLGWNEVRQMLHYRFAKGESTDPEVWTNFELAMDSSVWPNEDGFREAVRNAVVAHPGWVQTSHLLDVIPIQMEDRPRGALVLGSQTAQSLTEVQRQIAAIASSQAAAVYERHQDALTTTRLATMGNMISEIAHDLKKPLTNLKGSLQLLKQKHDELAETDPYLLSAEQEIHHLGDLVRELVEFSNPVRYPLDRVALHEPLNRALTLISGELERRGIKLQTELTDQAASVRGQESEMVQALLNVLHNAIDSMDDGGTLKVRTYIGVPPGQAEESAAIAVIDSGCGIPTDQHAKVFARHYTTKDSGSGLGLAIVERIMQAHNGQIVLNSEPEAGTELILYFPLAR